jgi:hypothetical protein
MRILALISIALLLGSCQSVYSVDDLRDPGMKGIILKKTRTTDSYFLYLQSTNGEQSKIEITSQAYMLVGEGDSLPLTAMTEMGSEVGEIDEEAAREGDGSEFTTPDPEEGEED